MKLGTLLEEIQCWFESSQICFWPLYFGSSWQVLYIFWQDKWGMGYHDRLLQESGDDVGIMSGNEEEMGSARSGGGKWYDRKMGIGRHDRLFTGFREVVNNPYQDLLQGYIFLIFSSLVFPEIINFKLSIPKLKKFLRYLTQGW